MYNIHVSMQRICETFLKTHKCLSQPHLGGRCPMVGRYAPLGFQKSLKPRNTLYTLPSEPQPDRKRI